VAAGAVSDEALGDGRLRVTLLGPFDIKLSDRSVGRWYRPPAKRLCELVLASPGLRVGREVAWDLLFAELEPAASATAISRALSLAREALSALGEDVAGRLRSDRAHIWFSTDALVDIDLVDHEKALRPALAMEPGGPRDAALSIALAEDGVLLEDEPYADWAVRPREALELLRQRARLELARDRARGRGSSAREAVIEAWEACLAHDATSEEAASSLMRVYSARGQHQAVSVTYERCRSALEALGLRASPALEEAQRAAMPLAPRSAPIGAGRPTPDRSATPERSLRDERRLVSVLFAELSGPLASHRGPARDWECQRSGRCEPPAFGALPTASARRARAGRDGGGSSLGERQPRARWSEAGAGSRAGARPPLLVTPALLLTQDKTTELQSL